jgi:uncharacterized sporulation protein YeaH/YhbH (DUF444 family)
LPNLVNNDIEVVDDLTFRRAGFTSDGTPAKMDILRSMSQAVGRRMALSGDQRRIINELRDQLKLLNAKMADLYHKGEDDTEVRAERDRVKQELEDARKGMITPFLDEMDLRYRQWTIEPTPATQAAMICVMDVSASMSDWHKDLAKRFFMLLYLFLHRNYDRIEMVFVRHHTTARECTEQEFFYDRDTGGTMVSEALGLANSIVEERYDRKRWNVYIAHASDGDSWDDDELTVEYFQKLCRRAQYYFYIEINRSGRMSDLHTVLESAGVANYSAAVVEDAKEIFPIFERLFKKR